MKKNFYISLSLILFVGVVVLYMFSWQQKQSENKNESSDKKMNVIVSILPQKTFVQAVAGDLVQVKVLIPPGGSPATYELKPSDLVSIEKADVYFRIGHIPFEKANLDKIISLNRKMKVVDTSEGIKLRHFNLSGDIDPHIWVAPREVKKQVEIIEKTLGREDLVHADIYKKNAEKFKKQLDELDAELKASFASLKTNKIMVFHPSWGYFADDYGLKQIVIEESGKEATAEQLKQIIDKARREGIRVIFVQSQFNKNIAKSIAKEIGATVVSINPLAEDYINNLENIAETIVKSLNE